MRLPRPRRFLRLFLICLALEWGGGPSAMAQGSGGYSRPSSSFSHSYGGLDRRPSLGGSGGYGRPSISGSGGFSADRAYGGDRAISRRSSGQALQDYRASQAPPAASRSPSAGGGIGGWSTAPSRRPEPSGWAGGAAPRFGAWDAVLAWSLLSSLSRSGNAAYFRDNRNTPGYEQWRADAERRAAGDPAVAQKLAELDALMSEAKAQPSSAHGGPTESSGAGVVWIVVIVGAAVLVGLWVMRRRVTPGAAGVHATAPPPGLGGSEASRFRVGMTIPLDPSPFLLAAGSTKVKPPPESGGMISVEALGLVADGSVSLHRLYLPGRESFFLLHLGPDGTPDECRYFSLLDQVAPASAEDWGFWLDPAQGMIGWPQFQTKDGKLYDRVWAPGSSRVPPRRQEETVQDLNGTTGRKLQAMLYGAHTGAAPPAPEIEYVLVCAVEQGGEAWVEVHSGIDINPASLTFPAVPLSS